MTETAPRRRKPLHPRLVLLILAVISVLYGLAIGLWRSRLEEGQDQPLALTLLIGAGIVVLTPAVVAVTLTYWRRLDEAAQEAHKWAWYWGGSLGLLPGLILAMSRGFSVEAARRLGYVRPDELVTFGAMAVVVFMLAGYLIAWAIWWLWRR